MSKITVLNEKAICVTVQSLAWGFDIWEAKFSLQGHKKGDLLISWMNGAKGEKEKLPPGSWSILAKGNEMTEEQWKGIVKPESTFGYPSYGQIPGGSFQWYAKPSSSGMALLKSKTLNPSEVIILIKQ